MSINKTNLIMINESIIKQRKEMKKAKGSRGIWKKSQKIQVRQKKKKKKVWWENTD